MNQMVLESYEMDHDKLHGRTINANCLPNNMLASKEYANSFPSNKP